MKRKLFFSKLLFAATLIVMLLSGVSVSAESIDDIKNDSTHAQLYRQFLNAYNEVGHEKSFYKVAEELCEYYRSKDLPVYYYKMQLNICLYDISNNHTNKALQRANQML